MFRCTRYQGVVVDDRFWMSVPKTPMIRFSIRLLNDYLNILGDDVHVSVHQVSKARSSMPDFERAPPKTPIRFSIRLMKYYLKIPGDDVHISVHQVSKVRSSMPDFG